jgi:putative phosphoribosyl transferase
MEREISEQTVQITAAPDVVLDGNLNLPLNPLGVVLFAHGSGSSRHSGRNRFVAHILNNAGLATLLIDLLMPDEEAIDNQTRHLRFDIAMLARRLAGTIDWLVKEEATRPLNIGLFGASTGAGAALVASTLRPSFVSAVVSRGGRPDLAGDDLVNVQAPTLLIVGEEDKPVIELNKRALQQLHVTKQLEIVPRATHLFEEPGSLETVALLARNWFLTHLSPENQ